MKRYKILIFGFLCLFSLLSCFGIFRQYYRQTKKIRFSIWLTLITVVVTFFPELVYADGGGNAGSNAPPTQTTTTTTFTGGFQGNLPGNKNPGGSGGSGGSGGAANVPENIYQDLNNPKLEPLGDTNRFDELEIQFKKIQAEKEKAKAKAKAKAQSEEKAQSKAKAKAKAKAQAQSEEKSEEKSQSVCAAIEIVESHLSPSSRLHKFSKEAAKNDSVNYKVQNMKKRLMEGIHPTKFKRTSDLGNGYYYVRLGDTTRVLVKKDLASNGWDICGFADRNKDKKMPAFANIINKYYDTIIKLNPNSY